MKREIIKKWIDLFNKYHGNNYRPDFGGKVLTPEIAIKRRAIRRHIIRLDFMYLNAELSSERINYLKRSHKTFL